MTTNGKAKGTSASTITGDSVYNRQDEELGIIYDLMVDMETGCVAYVVLSHGGFLGIGDKLYAVPWKALVLDVDREVFLMDLSRERLEQAPSFEKDNWPNMADEIWGRRIDEYYGVEPYWSRERVT